VVTVAWVVGSVVPDIAWFLLGRDAYAYGHSLPGVVTLDLALGVVIVVVWRLLLVAPVRDLLPGRLGELVPDRRGLDRREWPGVLLGVAAGALTHVVWDSFTHAGRWGSTHVPVLAAQLGPLPGHQWAQYASGVLGVAVLVLVVQDRYRSGPRTPVADRLASLLLRRLLGWGLLVAAVAAGLVAWAAAAPEGTHVAVVQGVGRALAALLLGSVAVGGLWWVLPRRAGSRVGEAVLDRA
jgi:hypothetical protein